MNTQIVSLYETNVLSDTRSLDRFDNKKGILPKTPPLELKKLNMFMYGLSDVSNIGVVLRNILRIRNLKVVNSVQSYGSILFECQHIFKGNIFPFEIKYTHGEY